MAEAEKSLGSVRFGPFELLLDTQELRKHGISVNLSGQAIQILTVLTASPGRLVTREELQQKLWPGASYGDPEHGLNAAINKLREKLGDSATTPTYVETLPGRGYRFIFPVESPIDLSREHGLHAVVPIAPPEPQPEPPANKPKRRWKLILAVALTTVALAASAVLVVKRSSYLWNTHWGKWLISTLWPPPPPPPLATQRPLTTNPDDTAVTGGVISPDGKYLAYADSTGLYLRQVESGETHAVPLPKGFDAFPESWFPDSAHLVVSRIEPGKGPPAYGSRRSWAERRAN
jgi:DNA-binding winged helix-turn-helix (wHTH) protein